MVIILQVHCTCTSMSALYAVFQYHCTCMSALYAVFQYHCTCMSVLYAVFQYHCTCMSVLYPVFQYFVVVGIIFVLEIVAGILAFVYRFDIEVVMQDELTRGLQTKYNTPEQHGLTETWDHIQAAVSMGSGGLYCT